MSEMSRAKALSILGLPQFGPAGDIRAAWRARVFELHPDRGGSSDDLALVNRAYAILRGEPVRERPASAERAAAPSHTVPRRAEVMTRLDPVSVDDRAICEARRAATSGSAGHVPGMVRRRGRRVSYFVDTPIETGRNEVFLPADAHAGSRRRTAKVVSFSAGASGAGEFEVPAETRDSLFPGARSLRVHFGRNT